jgi:hypothetical protein
MKNQHDPGTCAPPSSEEVTAALEAAGYPFEIRLFDKLRTGGMDPVFGHRIKKDAENESATTEIDVIARAHVCYPGKNLAVNVQLLALIQAKKIHAGGIVGFRDGVGPASCSSSSRVAVVGGLPCWGLLGARYNAHTELMTGAHGLHAGLLGFQVPHCIQWTTVRRQQKGPHIGEMRAEHEQGVFEDFASVVQASESMSRDISIFLLKRPDFDGSHLDLYLYQPTIFVDAPLWLYDATSKKLESTNWFSVGIAIDSSQGMIRREVDVVSVGGVDEFVAVYAGAGRALKAQLESGLDDQLALVGVAQHRAFKKEAQDKALARLGGIELFPAER